MRRQGEAAGRDAGSAKAYKGTLEFPDMTNADVDNGRFESDVSVFLVFFYSVGCCRRY